MEEISSLDSFGGDGGDSGSVQTDSVTAVISKLDDELSEHSAETPKDKTPTAEEDDAEVADEINKQSTNDGVDSGGGGVSTTVEEQEEEEDFEQISDGTFEVDENSQATETVAPMQDQNAEEKSKEDQEDENDPTATTGSNGDDEATAVDEAEEDEEAMDANDSMQSKDKTGDDSTDALGDAEEAVETTLHDGDEVDAAPDFDKSSAMDVDEEAQQEEVSATELADVEMQSSQNSPQRDSEKDNAASDELEEGKDVVDGEGDAGENGDDDVAAEKVTDSTTENVDNVEQNEERDAEHNEDCDQIDDVEAEHIEDAESAQNNDSEPKNVEHAESEHNDDGDVEHNDEGDLERNDDGDVEHNDDGDAEHNDDGDAEQVDDGDAEHMEDAEEDDNNAQEHADDEHGDNPVENVQEPEESDVCLIPDDTETQRTEAEKEQAILARENAEKEEEEEQAEADAAKNAENDATTTAALETSATSEGLAEDDADEANADADAQANNQAGAEADAARKSGEENNAANTSEANDVEEPQPEEAETETAGTETTETGAAPKTIITWIVASTQKCKQCDVEKPCGFRFKKLESEDSYEYLCELSCCNTLIKEQPGKYFVRRKKFLVEELASDESAIADDAAADEEATSTPDGVDKAPGTKKHNCLQCKESKQCKYFLKQDQETYYICNDDCYNLLNVEEPDKYKLKRHSIRVRNIGATTISRATDSPAKKNETRVIARTEAEAEAAREQRLESFRRRCADCHADVEMGDMNLLWETMDFCNEACLGTYQRTIGANCQTCSGEVSQTALGKYCVRFGFDIRQFCCAACLNVYKKGLKTCSCCQKDISGGNEGFLAPVGDKEQFKDFCSQVCLRRYDSMCNPKKKLRSDVCGVCNNEKPVRVEMILEGKEHYFCSNPCFSAFKFVSNVDADQCGMCCKYFERKGSEFFTIYTEQERDAKVFCSHICINVYIIVNRHIVSCQWCKVKKYNFDMIYKRQEDRDVLTCSLTCLSMYGVSMKAFSRAVAKCDQCNNLTTPQYHLTMSDSSIRNFCTYQCVMQFQNQFARAPLTLENELPTSSSSANASSKSSNYASNKSGAPFPTGLPKRVKLKYAQQQQIKPATKGNSNESNKKGNSGPVIPVISAVTSLAKTGVDGMIGSVSIRRGGRGRGRRMEPASISHASTPSTTATTSQNFGNIRGRSRKTVDDYVPPRSPTPPSLASSSFNSLRGRPRRAPVDYSDRTPSPVPLQTQSSRRGSVTASTGTGHNADYGSVTTVTQTETKIITLPPYPEPVRNVGVSVKARTVSVGFQSTPQTREIGIQTDKDYSNKVLIPVPVPIFVPQPMHMYSAPFPVPVPIPLPIPVPIFIPTTRNSAQGILKEIKKIQERTPSDPLEAELLMMAEMVAEEKNDSDSDSDHEIKPDPGLVQLQYNNSVQQEVEVSGANNSYNEDVLQMALKMATGDYEPAQPTVDLESAMTANTITNPPPGMVGHDGGMSQMNVHQQLEQQQIMDSNRAVRGRKRPAILSPGTPVRNNRSPVKRQRIQDLDSPIQTAQHSPQPQQPTEKPDAHMCLKYTFGVNAWKQWVMTKNADIEKSSMRRRTFKTDLLQMTADELNYSLCLFVKEVRKPNGTEYAPDTIYYLVLGIQQYLYVNGRIDNIFYDPFYERFTECLDEVARKFSVLYNDSQYIVTRVEEEHLWECKQLGAHSPHVLLSTLMFFNTKHFNLTTVEEHMQLSFSHIMKHWKRSAQNSKLPGTRNVLLRFYPPQAGTEANPRKKKVYEQQENEDNPLRCPVRLYEFYLSKCPESVKTRNDVFYLQPERSCVPDSPVWYSTQALSQDALQRMLHRVKMVKEINIALLTS